MRRIARFRIGVVFVSSHRPLQFSVFRVSLCFIRLSTLSKSGFSVQQYMLNGSKSLVGLELERDSVQTRSTIFGHVFTYFPSTGFPDIVASLMIAMG